MERGDRFFLSANEKGFRVIFCPHVVAFNVPAGGGGSHSLPNWKMELWIWRNHFYMLKKHRSFIRSSLGNPCPIALLFGIYALSRIWGQGRNLLWHVKRKLFFMFRAEEKSQ